MKQKQNNGIGRFDIVKGICMLNVLFYHYAYGNVVFQSGWMRTFWVVNNSVFLGTNYAFIFISGYRMRLRPIKKFFMAQINEMKGMYIWTAIATSALYFVARGLLTDSSLYVIMKESIQHGIGFLLGNTNEFKLGRLFVNDIGPMWFLLATFWAQNIVNAVLRSKFAKYSLCAMILAYLSVFPFYVLVPTEYLGILSIIPALTCCPVFYAGYLEKERKLLDRIQLRQALLLALVMAAIQTALFFATGKDLDELSRSSMNYYIPTDVFSFLWGVLLCYFGLWLNNSKAQVLEWIATIGRYSSYVFCVHTVEHLAFPWHLLYEIDGWNPYAVFFLVLVLRGAVVLLGCLLIHCIARNKRELKERLSGLLRKN